MRLPVPDVPSGLLTGPCRSPTPLGRLQLHARTASLGKANGDRLLWRPGPVLALTDVMYFFPNKFPRLGARRFTFASIFLGAFYGLLLGHMSLTLPLGYAPASDEPIKHIL